MDHFRFGDGKKTLVIIPGLSVQSVMGSADAVAEEYAIFAKDFSVYLFDRRRDLPQKYTVYDMADDTAEAIENLGLKDVYLFGASQGGMIAMCIALRFPHLVRKLALCSTAPEVSGDRMSVIDEWTDLAERGDAAGLYGSFAKKVYPASVYEQYSPALGLLASSVTEEELDRFIILAEGTKGFDVSDKLRSLMCPVLAAGSEDDEVLGGDAIHKMIGLLSDTEGFESIIYNGYGHAAYDTAPDFRERLYAFFTQEQTPE